MHLLRYPEHVVRWVFVRAFRGETFGGLGFLLEDDQAGRDSLVVQWLRIAAQLIGCLGRFSLEAEIAAIGFHGQEARRASPKQ
ncbi:hypothetical protein D8676_02660 [Mesorhizobium sp. YM1C-6-2]|nr:hypothetical protein D8676_02660 [Mesorhizobium sp. YM1C-6-2]